MRCPTLNELSPPPPDKIGWPWTEESPQLPDSMPDGRPWPRVSIVTPSYNQGEFIEETIRSVLLQGYPDLEYIIIDGGSTDGSVDIIRKYEPWLTYWVSEPDQGQADAINKGFRHSTGELLAWLNSDDVYIDRCAIARIVELSCKYPQADIITGGGLIINEESQWIQVIATQRKDQCYKHLRYRDTILQPSTFFKVRVFRTVGIDTSLSYAFDWDFFIRASHKFNILPIDHIIAGYRMYGSNKTAAGGAKRAAELLEVTSRYLCRLTWQYYILLVIVFLYYVAEKIPSPMKIVLLSGIKEASRFIYVLSSKRISVL